MPMPRIQNTIIGVLAVATALLLQGCSSVRLAYGNAPQLAWWWLDGYVDFSGEQTPLAKRAIDGFFDWHRTTQLPEFLPLLTQAQATVLEPATPALTCAWQDRVRARFEPSIERAVSIAADLAPGLGEAQFKSLEQRYAKTNEETVEKFLQPDPRERQDAAYKRALERAERLYGRLGEPQKRVLREGVAASPFDPEIWLRERQRRQRDTLQTLRRLQAEPVDRGQRVVALRQLASRFENSPEAAYRVYQQKLTAYNCLQASQLHNATTPVQRQNASGNLKGWQDDLQAIIAGE